MGRLWPKVALWALLCQLSGATRVAIAEVWECRNQLSGKTLLTTSPVTSHEQQCRILRLDLAPYNKITAEEFARFRYRGDSEPANEVIKKFIPKQPPQEPELHTVWKAHEINSGRALGWKCVITGRVYARSLAKAILVIRRGAATVDLLELELNPDSKATPWEVKLRGRCRKPQVRIKSV